MTFHAHPVPPVPDATAAATLAACPNGTPSFSVREERGTLFTDALFADWFAPVGAPVSVGFFEQEGVFGIPLRLRSSPPLPPSTYGREGGVGRPNAPDGEYGTRICRKTLHLRRAPPAQPPPAGEGQGGGGAASAGNGRRALPKPGLLRAVGVMQNLSSHSPACPTPLPRPAPDEGPGERGHPENTFSPFAG
jgi:hypothetical protein